MGSRSFILILFGALLAGAVASALDRGTHPKLSALADLDPSDYPNCVLAPAPAQHLLISATAADGATLSTVVVGADDPKPDTSAVIRISITEGDQPITVFVAGRSGTIWQFDGATARVRRVVALSRYHDQRVAIGGIVRDRIEFINLGRCPLFGYASEPASGDDTRVQQRALKVMFGRPADRVVSEWKVRSFVLPEGTIDAPRVDPSADPTSNAAQAMALFNPGGGRDIDPATLVSPVRISVPAVKPGELGLLDLERDGSIRRPQPQEVASFVEAVSGPYRSKLSPDYRLPVRFDYVVTRGIELPVGLYGPRSKRFLVLSGVPVPRGERAHNCIAYMDGFRMEDGSMCVGRYATALENLAKLPNPNQLTTCRVWEPPAQASLQAIAIHGRSGSRPGLGGQVVPATVTVHVRKAGDVALILSAYEGISWQIDAGPQTRIAGVIVIGHDPGVARGLATDTPMKRLYHDPEKPKPDKASDLACAPFLEYFALGYEGGAEAMNLDRQVELLTGRKLDGLISQFRVSEVEIQ